MEEPRRTRRLTFLVLSLLLLLLSPYLFSLGMFFDGLTYAAVSRNLAIGFGTLWKPAYSLTIGREFYGHPPLGFWIQSVAYRLFGDHLWVDKAFTYAVASLNLLLFYLLYRSVRRDGDPGFWAPLLLLVSFHSYRWVIRNGLLENTMTSFVLLSLILYTLSLRRPYYGIPAGLSVLAAFLVKGPVGTFPLVSPLLLPSPSPKKRLAPFLLGAAAFSLSFALLMLLPEVRHFFSEYLHRQIFRSVTGGENPAPSRLYILYAIATEMAFPSLFLLPLSVFLHLKREVWVEWDGRTFGLLLLALSGSLPIMLSLKQARFYLHPSLFIYALFLTSLFRPALRRLESWRPVDRLVVPTSLLLLLAALSVALRFAGTGKGGYEPFYRDFVENPLHLNLRHHEYLSVCPRGLYGNWSMFAGMERAFMLSMTQQDGSPFLLVSRRECRSIPDGYLPIHGGKQFVLYRRAR